MTVHRKSLKTNAFRCGHCLMFIRTFSPICALMAMHRYFLLTTPPQGPLLCFQSNRYLTRRVVAQLLRNSAMVVGLPHHSLKGHSFHIGAAQLLLPVCQIIKVLGCWSSDCYQSPLSFHMCKSQFPLVWLGGMQCLGCTSHKLVGLFVFVHCSLSNTL